MYTISMRPYCPYGAVRKCINFEQERSSWDFASFTDPDAGAIPPIFGVTFSSPLESIDISVVQLAAMIAGLDSAYEALCDKLYEDAPNDLAKTPWLDRDTFMSCIPRGMWESPSEISNRVFQKDVLPIPFLRNKETGMGLAWSGAEWGLIDLPADVDTYNSAGTCFGWDVLYKEEEMSTDCVREPRTMAFMLATLLKGLAWLNTDAKIYVQNIYSVQ